MTADFGARMRGAREAAGMTQQDVVFAVRQMLPEPMWISQTKLQRLEAGKIPEEKADPFEIVVLASIYDERVIDLSDSAAEKLSVMTEVVARSRCFSHIGVSDDAPLPAAA